MKFIFLSDILLFVFLGGCVTPQQDVSPEKTKLLQKFNSIHIKSIQFDKAPVTEVVDYLVEQSVLADREGLGIPVGFDYAEDLRNAPVLTLNLQGVSFAEAIKALCKATGLMYHLDDQLLRLSYCHLPTGPLTTRGFRFSQDKLFRFVKAARPSPEALRKLFLDFGIERSKIARISYSPSTEVLTVSGEPQILAQIEAILDRLKVARCIGPPKTGE